MRVIQMSAGEHIERTLRISSMPSHSGSTGGEYTFAVYGLDMGEYTQWSVVGARKSELVKTDESKLGCDRCVVHISGDEYTSEERIVSVSVIGVDVLTKEQVETNATLTLSIIPKAAKEDFSLTVDGPSEIIYREDGTIHPEVKVTATLDQKTGSSLKGDFSGYLVIDVQGDRFSETVFEMKPIGSDVYILESPDLTTFLEDIVIHRMGNREYLEGSYTVEVWRNEDNYYHFSGKTFFIRIER